MIENIANWVDQIVWDYIPQAQCYSELDLQLYKNKAISCTEVF